MKQPKLDLEMIDATSIDWNPKPDITAYELARCMPLITYLHQAPDHKDYSEYSPMIKMLDWLPKEVQRHFNFRHRRV